MPRFITRDDLSRSQGESRSIVRGASNGLGRALQGFAGSIAKAGAVVGGMVDDEREKDKALDLTKARSFLQIGLMKTRAKYTYDKDQDQDTWGTRFADEAKQIHEQAGELIRDPTLKQHFLVDAAPDVERVQLDVDGSATKIRQERRITESDNAIDQALEGAAGSDASEAQQAAMLRDIHANIDGLVKNGVYTPEMGAARRVKAVREFAGRRALSDIQADPAQAKRWLQGGGGGDDDAAFDELIRKDEDFKPTPYPDGPPENRVWRIGYGSDTITTADGKHIKVKPGMRITREDAERDLKYRRGETQGRVKSQIGKPVWEKLSLGAKVALTGMAYNYGSLPDSVVAAARTGDPKKLADAVRARAGDRGNGIPGLNAQRRFKEAAMIESGDAGLKDRPHYYDLLSQEDKLKLTNAAETAVADQDQAVTQEARQAEADARAAAAARKGSIDLGIEQGGVSRESIINDPLLDDGDKAELVRKWESHEADNISAAEAWQAVQDGVPLGPDANKGLDQLFKSAGGAAALAAGDPKATATVNYLWSKGQAMPPAAKTTIEGMVKSSNPDQVIGGLALLDQLQRNNPVAFDATFGEATAKNLLFYQNNISRSPADIVQELRRRSDPQTIKAREPMVQKGQQEASKNYDADKIAALFPQGYFNDPTVQNVELTDRARNVLKGSVLDRAMLERDFNRVFADAYADNPDTAEANAIKMLGRTWGVSETNGGHLMRYPPERYADHIDGSYEWMTKAVESDLKSLGYTVEQSGDVTNPFPEDKVKNYIIQPLPMTESDIASGQSPHYAIIVQDPETGVWDVAMSRDESDRAGRGAPVPLAYVWDKTAYQKANRDEVLVEGRKREKKRKEMVKGQLDKMKLPVITSRDQLFGGE